MNNGSAPADLAVSVQNLHVRFQATGTSSFGLRFLERNVQEVDALRNVSFELGSGEALGIVGHNGAGKSTLLRAIAGLLPVSSGRVLVREQPQLLGVQAALIGKLSGSQNIELGLLANGCLPGDLAATAAEVADFTNLGRKLQLQVRTYSSGMRARLAFAIATTIIPEILLMDEALAVGDKDFKRRSLRRMRQIRRQAGTIILATHSLNEIAQTCDRAMWLTNGEVIAIGKPDDVLDKYRASRTNTGANRG